MNQPKVSIIIAHLFDLDFLMNCLKSVFASDYHDLEVIVVFNGNLDGACRVVKKEYPQVIAIQNKKNRGFVVPNNQGFKKATGDAFFMLNDDTVIHPHLISVLVENLFKDKKIGIVGPKIYYMDEPRKIWFAGGKIDWATQTHWHLGRDVDDSQWSNRALPQEVDFITGCALLIKREVVQKIGFLSRIFYAFYEDADWCQKAKKAGFKVVYVPFGGVWHAKSNTAGSVFFGPEKKRNFLWLAGTYLFRNFRREIRRYKNKFIFFKRHLPIKFKPRFYLKFVFRDLPSLFLGLVFRVPKSFLQIIFTKKAGF